MKNETQKKQSTQSKAKKPELKIRKEKVKDLDAEKASQQIKGGQRCGAVTCLATCPASM